MKAKDVKAAMIPHRTRLTKRLGMFVRHGRHKMGLRQALFAGLLDIDQSALSRVENGKQQLSAVQFLTLCELADLDPSAVLEEGFEEKYSGGFAPLKRKRGSRLDANM